MGGALTPHPLHQRPDFLTGLYSQLLGQAGLKALEERERPGTIACQGSTPQSAPKRRLRGRLESKRPLGKPASLLHLSDLRVGFRAACQHLHPPPAPQFTLRPEPILEFRGFGQRKPLEKLTRDQLGCRRPVARRRELLQPVHVQLHRCRGQANLPDRYLDGPFAGVKADDPQRLAQGVPGRRLRPVAPQQADQVLATPAAARRAREIDQQGKMLPPKEFGRCRTPIYTQFDGPQCAAKNHGGEKVP
jgi:hypothetical protein